MNLTPLLTPLLAAVRQTLLNRGIQPENLPSEEDVKKVERRLASADRKALKKPDTLDD